MFVLMIVAAVAAMAHGADSEVPNLNDPAIRFYFNFDGKEDYPFDLSPRGKHGGLYGARLEEFGSGRCIVLPHTNACASLGGGNADHQFGTDDFSLVLWYKLDNPDTGVFMGKKEIAPHAAGWVLEYDDLNSKLRFRCSDGKETGVLSTSCKDTLWHHLAVVREAGKVVLYLDGKAVDRASGGAFASNWDYRGERLFFGRIIGDRNPISRADEIELYSRALSAAEVGARHERFNRIITPLQPTGTALRSEKLELLYDVHPGFFTLRYTGTGQDFTDNMVQFMLKDSNGTIRAYKKRLMYPIKHGANKGFTAQAHFANVPSAGQTLDLYAIIIAYAGSKVWGITQENVTITPKPLTTAAKAEYDALNAKIEAATEELGVSLPQLGLWYEYRPPSGHMVPLVWAQFPGIKNAVFDIGTYEHSHLTAEDFYPVSPTHYRMRHRWNKAPHLLVITELELMPGEIDIRLSMELDRHGYPDAQVPEKLPSPNICFRLLRSDECFGAFPNPYADFIGRTFFFTKHGREFLLDIDRSLLGPFSPDAPRNNPPFIQVYTYENRTGGKPVRKPIYPGRGWYVGSTTAYTVPVIGTVSQDGKYLAAYAGADASDITQAWRTCLHHRISPTTWTPQDAPPLERQHHFKFYLLPNDPDLLLAKVRKDFPQALEWVDEKYPDGFLPGSTKDELQPMPKAESRKLWKNSEWGQKEADAKTAPPKPLKIGVPQIGVWYDESPGIRSTVMPLVWTSFPGLSNCILDIGTYEHSNLNLFSYRAIRGGKHELRHRWLQHPHVIVVTELTPAAGEVELVARLELDMDEYPDASFPAELPSPNICFRLVRSVEQFGADPKTYDDFIRRSFIYTEHGREFMLDISRNLLGTTPLDDPRNSPPWIQIYRCAEFYPDLIPARPHPGPSNYTPSFDKAVLPIIGTVSQDGRAITAMVSGGARSLTQAWRTCLHHSFTDEQRWRPASAPISERRMRVKFYVMENDSEAMLERISADFPKAFTWFNANYPQGFTERTGPTPGGLQK